MVRRLCSCLITDRHPESLLSLGSAVLLLVTACAPALRAAPAAPTSPVRSGSIEATSPILDVDACNQAQKQLPAGSTLTGMQYGRGNRNNLASVTCRASWSTATDAKPTRRPILFGPTP